MRNRNLQTSKPSLKSQVQGTACSRALCHIRGVVRASTDAAPKNHNQNKLWSWPF